MVGIIIVAHGSLAGALLNTSEQIAGKQEQIVALAFAPGEDVVELQLRIQEAIKQVDQSQGVLVLVDLLGGSPYNAAALVAMQQPGIEVVAGVNVPMLLEIIPVRNDKLTDVTSVALKGGFDGIGKFVMFKK